jgi:hypothetical protein
MSLPKSLPECSERLDAAQAAIGKTQTAVRVAGSVALAIGIAWGIWELIGRKTKTEPLEDESV